MCFPNILGKKWIFEFRRTNPRNWNAYQLSVLITSWDITKWCSINLLWKELMKRMSEHTGLISSCQLLITVACTNTGSKMKGSHSRAADRCPFVPRHNLSQVTSFMQLGMLCLKKRQKGHKRQPQTMLTHHWPENKFIITHWVSLDVKHYVFYTPNDQRARERRPSTATILFPIKVFDLCKTNKLIKYLIHSH